MMTITKIELDFETEHFILQGWFQDEKKNTVKFTVTCGIKTVIEFRVKSKLVLKKTTTRAGGLSHLNPLCPSLDLVAFKKWLTPVIKRSYVPGVL